MQQEILLKKKTLSTFCFSSNSISAPSSFFIFQAIVKFMNLKKTRLHTSSFKFFWCSSVVFWQSLFCSNFLHWVIHLQSCTERHSTHSHGVTQHCSNPSPARSLGYWMLSCFPLSLSPLSVLFIFSPHPSAHCLTSLACVRTRGRTHTDSRKAETLKLCLYCSLE